MVLAPAAMPRSDHTHVAEQHAVERRLLFLVERIEHMEGSAGEQRAGGLHLGRGLLAGLLFGDAGLGRFNVLFERGHLLAHRARDGLHRVAAVPLLGHRFELFLDRRAVPA